MVSLIAGSDEDELKGLRRALDGIEVGSADALLDAFLRESRGETRAKLAFMLWDVPFTHKQMRAIVKSLDRERNAKERDAVLGALIGSSDAKRMDTLFGCLRGGLFINRHLYALVRVCGERRRAEAVRHLGAVLAWHPRFYQRGGDALRAAAAVSLGQIGSDESLAVLGQYAGDRDPAVRKACERAIAAPRVK
jgi:HEAT repeat protein